jgi:hypothetical protein
MANDRVERCVEQLAEIGAGTLASRLHQKLADNNDFETIRDLWVDVWGVAIQPGVVPPRNQLQNLLIDLYKDKDKLKKHLRTICQKYPDLANDEGNHNPGGGSNGGGSATNKEAIWWLAIRVLVCVLLASIVIKMFEIPLASLYSVLIILLAVVTAIYANGFKQMLRLLDRILDRGQGSNREEEDNQ